MEDMEVEAEVEDDEDIKDSKAETITRALKIFKADKARKDKELEEIKRKFERRPRISLTSPQTGKSNLKKAPTVQVKGKKVLPLVRLIWAVLPSVFLFFGTFRKCRRAIYICKAEITVL
jgi:hypothetical protein